MTNADERFRALFDEHYRSILGYALRRVPTAVDAADIANESFAVAWRRIDDVPTEPETRPWLYGVARHVLSNHTRSARRRNRLSQRIGQAISRQTSDEPESLIVTRNAIEQAMRKLPAVDREILQLTAWEECTPPVS